jgi:hypothetical protein
VYVVRTSHCENAGVERPIVSLEFTKATNTLSTATIHTDPFIEKLPKDLHFYPGKKLHAYRLYTSSTVGASYTQYRAASLNILYYVL